jgi:hypothetical protein
MESNNKMNVSEEDAIRIAKEHAEKNGWYWNESPMTGLRHDWWGGGGKWSILVKEPSQCYRDVATTFVEVDLKTGEILQGVTFPPPEK